MVKNTFRIFWRNALRYRMHTFITLAGLGMGLTCFIIIALFVKHELSYDTQFSAFNSIYRVTMSSQVGGSVNKIPTSYAPIGPEMKDRFGEVKAYARLINYKYTRQQPTFRVGEKVFYEERVVFADSTFFEIFDFSFRSGDRATALTEPNSVVITESMSQKYFGDKDALGRTIQFEGRDVIVTGVLSAIPSNTHLQFDFILPMTALPNSALRSFGSDLLTSWQVDWFWDYLLIQDPTSVSKLEEGINKLAAEKTPDTFKEYDLKFYLQPLRDVHLHSDFDYNTDLTANGDSTNVYILACMGLLVLVISGINFINISMASATRRYKEVGISKVLGAVRSQLHLQYITESVVTSLVALAVAFVASWLLLPVFSQMLGVEGGLQLQDGGWWLGGIILFTIAVGIISGVYPAFFVSSFEPQRVLTGIWKPGRGGARFRNILMGVQIAIALFLIVGSVVVNRQLNFVHGKSLGYDKEHVVMLPIRGTAIPKSFVSFKDELLQQTAIENVSSVSEPIGREVQFMSFRIEGKEEDQFVKILNVTHDFIQTMNLELVEGRDFSSDIASDSSAGFLINEAAAKAFGWNQPLGKAINHTWFPDAGGKVIGVVKDFNFEPLQKQVDPIILWFGRPLWYAAVRVGEGKRVEALQAMELAWKKFEPEKPFSFHFLDESIQHVYEKEERLSKLFIVFAALSITTAMLGLYGIIAFILEQRMKEIGVRKVMGASVQSIVTLVTKDYLVLVLVAFVASIPFIWWVVDTWLEGFAYRIEWNAWYYLAGLLVTVAVVVLTVLSKTISVAHLNPTKVLRNE